LRADHRQKNKSFVRGSNLARGRKGTSFRPRGEEKGRRPAHLYQWDNGKTGAWLMRLPSSEKGGVYYSSARERKKKGIYFGDTLTSKQGGEKQRGKKFLQ